MKIRTSLIVLMAMVSFSCTEELTSAIMEEPDGNEASETPASAVIPGEMIVEFSDDFIAQIEIADEAAATKAFTSSGLLELLGITRLERLYPDAGEWEERHRAAGLHRWYRVSYDPLQPATKAAVSLESLDFVKYVEPARRIKSMSVFNDPDLSRQWHYSNPGAGRYAKGADINVTPVWENFTAGSRNVIVSVVDGGIQTDHPDLAGVVIPGGTEGSKNFVEGFTGYSISATEHGTHVAGTIAAINNNGLGGCGVAGGSDGNGGVRLLSCQIFSDRKDKDGNEYQGDAYNAMVWGADHGAVISQNSWGYDYENAAQAKKGSVGAMKGAIDYFIKNAGTDKNGNQLPDSPMKGGVVIFAAGNDAWPDGWPAEYEPVIAVGAMNATMSRSSYSNYGDWVDICAPGGDNGIDPMIYSTLPGGGYGYMQGTSMACPHVSGVAALIVSYFGGPGFTNEMLVERLLGGANYDTALKGQKIGPLVDAYGAFMVGGTTPPECVAEYTASSSANTISFDWNVTADSDSQTGKAYAYLLLASENRDDFNDLNPRALPSGMASTVVETGNAGLGESLTGVIGSLKFDTDYYVAIVGYDFSKNWSALSEVRQIRTKENNAPVIDADVKGEIEVKAHETATVVFSVSDPDGHPYSVDFRSGSAADGWRAAENGEYRLTIVGKNAPAGTYTASISATDNVGEASLTTTLPVKYTILENHRPEKLKDIEDKVIAELGVSYRIDMTEYVLDPDGETLVYEISHSNPSVAHLNPVDNTLTLTSLNYGVDEVTVKATDCLGEYCTVSFRICVGNSSEGIGIYPTSVRDVLYITSAVETTVYVGIVNSAGKTVLRKEGRAGIFDPLKIDVTGLGRGLYTVIVTSGGTRTTGTISKL